MPNWKKVITSGSNAELNNLYVTNHVTASGDLRVQNGTTFLGTGAGNPYDVLINDSLFLANTSTPQIYFGSTANGFQIKRTGTGIFNVFNSTFYSTGRILTNDITASFTGSFTGDGSGLTGISAGGGGIFAATGSYQSTTNDLQITGSLQIYKSGSTVFNIEGSQGTLFSVTDELEGSLFSVNDISGIPIFEVFSDNTLKMGTFNSEELIISQSSVILGSTLNSNSNTITNCSSVTSSIYRSPTNTIESTSGTTTFDVRNGVYGEITLTENITTFNIANLTSGTPAILKINTGTGGPYTVTGWTISGGSVKWPAGTAPTISTVDSSIDIITFISDGTDVYGSIIQDFQ